MFFKFRVAALMLLAISPLFSMESKENTAFGESCEGGVPQVKNPRKSPLIPVGQPSRSSEYIIIEEIEEPLLNENIQVADVPGDVEFVVDEKLRAEIAAQLKKVPGKPALKAVKTVPVEVQLQGPEYDKDQITPEAIEALLGEGKPFDGLTKEQSWDICYGLLLEWSKGYSHESNQVHLDYSSPSMSFDSVFNFYLPLAKMLDKGFLDGSPLRSDMAESCLLSLIAYGSNFNALYDPNASGKRAYYINRIAISEGVDVDAFIDDIAMAYTYLDQIYIPRERQESKEKIKFPLGCIQLDEQRRGIQQIHCNTEFAEMVERNNALESLAVKQLKASLDRAPREDEKHDRMQLLGLYYDIIQKKHPESNVESIFSFMSLDQSSFDTIVENLVWKGISPDSSRFERKLRLKFNSLKRKRLLEGNNDDVSPSQKRACIKSGATDNVNHRLDLDSIVADAHEKWSHLFLDS